MKFRTTFACLLLAPTTLIAQPAAAATASSATIAYAQRAQTWELVLTNGKVVKVPEALAVAPADAVNAGSRTSFLVSGDGRNFFYFRKSDGLFVQRTLNSGERVVSRKLTADNIYEEWPSVSDDGSYVVTETSGPGLGILADLRTGKVLPPPKGTDSWQGFSPDSNRLLLEGDRAIVFDRGLRGRTPVKSRLSPLALANDYVTVAAPVGKTSKLRKLRLLNLRTGRTISTVTARLPRGQYIDDLDFDRSGRLIVRSKTKTGVAVYRLSKTTGKATLVRTLARPKVKVWVLPGDGTYEPWTEK
ncbi:hypothetical protein ACQP2T_04030 [Nonomuraea sp. CA-143628]|uniref:hypothetical protein n=1 Tax=Nonomuraea sp. CA-143628 TaxID=3239997 RepID=UPI003D8BADFC